MSREEEYMRILSEKSYRIMGEEARISNIRVARVIAETVRSSLGPRGMEKMVVDPTGEVVVTNDGATILKKMHVKHPCAKFMVEIGETQEREAGDGTKTAVVLAGELLRGAEELLKKNVHPMVIVKGYKIAQKEAMKLLREVSKEFSPRDEALIRKVALTSLNSRIMNSGDKNHIISLVMQAVKFVAEEFDGGLRIDKENIKIQKQTGGLLGDSEVVNGIILEKGERVHPLSPKVVDDAKIAVFNTQIMFKRLETDAKLEAVSPEDLDALLREREGILRDIVRVIVNAGANCVFNFKTIDDKVHYWLAKENILAVKAIPEDEIKLIARATGAKIITHLRDLTPKDLGKARRVVERKVGGNTLIFIEGCENPRAVTILLRGSTDDVLSGAEGSLDDAISVVKDFVEDPAVLPGGGAVEMEVAKRLRGISNRIGGREQLAVNKFAEALESIPEALAENAGFDPIDALTKLRSEHVKGKSSYGLDLSNGESIDMFKMGIIEPLRVKQRAVKSATEAAITIIRVDDIIAAKAPGESKETIKKFEKEFTF